jgi:hypothetical protein
MVTLGVALSGAVASLVPSVIPRFFAAFNGGSESGETTSTGPPFLGVGDRGSAVTRACSSSRCFFFRIAKSFKDILTFGTFGGGGVEAASVGDCAGGGSEATNGSGEARDRDEAGDRSSTWLFGGHCTRVRGSDELRGWGDGERTHGVGPESQRSESLSRSICVGPRVSASGEVVEVVNKKEDVKVDNLGERGDESEECEAVGDSSDKLANGVEGEGKAGRSESWEHERDDGEGSLLVKTRGEFG